jgi:hypothetical protein
MGFGWPQKKNPKPEPARPVGRMMAERIQSLPGDLMNAPNSIVGNAMGLGGHLVARASGGKPRIEHRDGAIEYINSPMAPFGALTIGNAIMYRDDPYDPANRNWDHVRRNEGHSVQAHERAHIAQGRALGPLYLPAYGVAAATSLLRSGKWHGPTNFMEAGPMPNPIARPWPPRRP